MDTKNQLKKLEIGFDPSRFLDEKIKQGEIAQLFDFSAILNL